MKKIIFIIGIICFSSYVYSQKQTYVGLYHANGLVTDYSAYYDASNTIGVCIESQFSKNWGIGGCLNVHNYNFNNASTNFKYSSIPLYLKYYSKIINVSGIIFLESYMNKSGNIIFSDTSPLNNFGDFNYGLGISISKHIDLTEKLIIEPDIRLISNSIDGLNSEILFGVNLLYKL